MNSFQGLLLLIAAYAMGSISFAVWVTRCMGLQDPRTYGSQNPGATNVLRSGSKLAAALTLLGDVLKGVVAVLLARLLVQYWGWTAATMQEVLAWVGLAAFLGHLFPLWHGFKGGKGVATAAGILLALNGWLGLATLLTWAIVLFFFRYVSLASIIAAAFAAFYNVLLFGTEGSQALAVFVMAGLLIYRHKENIGRLLAGKESRIGQHHTNK